MKKARLIIAAFIMAAIMLSFTIPVCAIAESPLENVVPNEKTTVEAEQTSVDQGTEYKTESGAKAPPNRRISPLIMLVASAMTGAAITVVITLLIQKRRRRIFIASVAPPIQIVEHNNDREHAASTASKSPARWVEVTKGRDPFAPAEGNKTMNDFFSEPKDL